eukprot:TRINITY_DN1280_c0_g1_i7.p1 TRINITY_DN1280_c0_g1~~TRINITY_DN1280_c0_g1_i7.p1  ORF type:complete len:1450 (-),score=287.98 TRINITY_DN1280_c0_g1_i7:539-4609(-)
MLLSLLGVLRAGKAYCPIEPDFPASRVESMLESAAIRHALVPADQLPQPVLAGFTELMVFGVHSDGRLELSRGCPSVKPSWKPLPETVKDDATAYVLFTSGSTGKPKGCMVAHRGSCNYAKQVVQSCGLTKNMVFLLKTPYVFDVSVQDIFTAFAAGGTLLIAPHRAERDAGAICDIIGDHSVNCACFVPTLLVEFANYLSAHPEDVARVGASLQRVLTIGEALMTATCKQLFQHLPALQIHNLYGPTEASVGVSHHMITAATAGDEVVVPIGRPFSYVSFKAFDVAKYENQKIEARLLDEVDNEAIGELFIGGDCLANGYINNPEKTNAAFFKFPEVMARPADAASPFSMYKTGDLVRRRPDGIYEYMGRCDFQVKIGGVRIECEEVSAVLQEHPAVEDALVTAFDGPFGKALAAYVVVAPGVSPADVKSQVKEVEVAAEKKAVKEESIENVSKWGAIYDEMYMEQDNSISDQDPTLNWSGYIDTYTGKSHVEHVIKEWVEWSCEQVSAHKEIFDANRAKGKQSCVLEIGCGNGMLLFRLAGLVGTTAQGRYIGTDISTTALDYIKQMQKRPEYKSLGIETAQLAAHEVHQVCKPRECDVALCNGVTMYFPSAAYLLDSMRMAVDVTKPQGHVLFGDIQSKRHLLVFRAHVETYHALQRSEATAAAVLHSVYEMASHEELSYFDDELFHRLDRLGADNGFGGRVERVELRLKRGWWGSEFSRFRYDVELVLGDGDSKPKSREPTFKQVTYSALCTEMSLKENPDDNNLADPKLAKQLKAWTERQINATPKNVDGFVVTLPNARTLQAARVLDWLKIAAKEGTSLTDLPSKLLPRDVNAGNAEGSEGLGIEPEMLFTMTLPAGWTKRVIWAEDPAMLRFVVLRTAAAECPWLGAVCSASRDPLPQDLSCYKNQPSDIEVPDLDPMKVWNEHLKEWSQGTRLLPAMRPAVFVTLDSFPKNAAGKTDRGKLPDALEVMERVSDVATFSYEPPSTKEEEKMVAIWENVLAGRQIGVNTPFIAYGGHSLTAVKLSSAVCAEFGVKPDLLFLTSADCTVRDLLKKIQRAGDPSSANASGSIVRLSPKGAKGAPLLILCAAGSSAASYQAVAEQLTKLQVYAVELPGRGSRANEESIAEFDALLKCIMPDVEKWTKQHSRFFLWGDSLGAILAYELACRFEQSPSVHVMGLFVSGNAGPTVADGEQGVGGTVELPGCDTSSAKNLSDEDWKRFLLASSGEGSTSDLSQILADPAMAQAVINPLKADCLAYESYRMSKMVRLCAPIVTLCGARDTIATPCALQTWAEVAKGRIQHSVIPNIGHRIAQESPDAVAHIIQSNCLAVDQQSHASFLGSLVSRLCRA